MRILFISHAASMGGAPISLLILMRYFKKHYDWDIRILVRYKGVLLPLFSQVAPMQCFFEYRHYQSLFTKILNRLSKIIGPDNRFYRHIQLLINHCRKIDKKIEARKQNHHEQKLKKDISGWAPDLIYSNTAVNGEIIRKLNLKVPVVVHVRELDVSLKILLDKPELDYFKKYPSFYFAVSNAVKIDLMEKYDVPASKLAIAPVAIEFDEIIKKSKEFSNTEIRKSLGLCSNDIIIGGVGYVGERKGSDLFVEVAKKVIRQTHNKYPVAFVWVGDGVCRKKLQELVKKEKLDDRILFIGMKMNPYPYINCFDITFTSSRDDPFPRVNLESGALGKPVVAFSDSGGSKEFIEDDCGFSVPGFSVDIMTEKIIELVENENQRKKFGKNAQNKVKAFYDAPAVAKPIAALIEQKINTNFLINPAN